jgi:hypothetical protein
LHRAAFFGALAGTLALVACADSPTEPAILIGQPLEVMNPLGDLPRESEVRQPDGGLPSVSPNAVIAFVSTRDAAEYIYVANADGSDVTRLTEGSSPAWSWDGRKLAFVRRGSRAGPAGIYVLDLDSPTPRFMGPGHRPVWLPGDRVAFIRYGVLRSMNADGSDVALLLHPYLHLRDWEVAGPSWVPNYQIAGATPTPDGRSIWFRTGGTALGARAGIVDANGDDPREVEALRGLGTIWSGPALSPDGSKAVVITDPGPWQACDPWLGCRSGAGMGRSSVIYSYDLASGNLEVIKSFDPASVIRAAHPDWSPDGSHLVFHRFDPSGEQQAGSGQPRIFTMSLETREARRLIAEAANPAVVDYADYDPVWSRARR